MPRAGLTPDRVTDEAALLADEVGLDKLTLSALAERLGIRQPSLYRHIDSMAGLLRNIAVQSKRELGDALTLAAVGRSGPDAIRAMSHAYRGWALEHPARYQASNRMPAAGDLEDEAVSMAAIQIVADVLHSYHLEGDDAIDAIRAFRSTLHGFVSYETSGAFRYSADVDRSFDRLVNGFTAALTVWTESRAGDSPRTSGS